MNSRKIKVYLTFTNKKGIKKKVHFLMDKETYMMLQKVSEEERDKYMLEEYRWFCKEQKHQRRTQSINSFYDEDGELIIDSGEEAIKTLSYDEELVQKMLESLSEMERNIMILIYFEKYTQGEVAKIYNCSQQKVSYIHNKIIEKLRKNFSY